MSQRWWSRKSTTPAGCLAGRWNCSSRTPRRIESVAVGNVRKLIQRDKVDLVLGGITSSMRNAIKDVIVGARQDALHLSAALRGQGMHALSVLHRPDAGAAVRRIHSLADQERRQEVRAAERQLCLASHPERLCAQGDRGQWRRSRLRGILPARPDRLQCHGEPGHFQQGGRGVQHRDPARAWDRSSSSFTRRAS